MSIKTIQQDIRLVTGYPEKMAGYPANSVSGATLHLIHSYSGHVAWNSYLFI